jgi:hypothetical protein
MNRGENEFRDVNASNFWLPGYASGMNRRSRLADEMARRQAYQLGPAAQAGQSAFRGQQQDLFNQLRQRASGQGPSIADMQMQRGMQQATAQQQALAATGRGNSAMSARNASQNASGLSQQMAGQAAMARLQEQQQAQGMLGSMLGQARGQDIAQNQFNAGQLNQHQMAQLKSELEQRGLNDAAQQQYLMQMIEMQRAQQLGQIESERARTQRFNALTGVATPGEQNLALIKGGLDAYALWNKSQGNSGGDSVPDEWYD